MMKTILYPGRSEWNGLCKRPLMRRDDLDESVKQILEKVRTGGDKAVRECSEIFDGFAPDSLKVEESEIITSADMITDELKAAMITAMANIEIFHSRQLIKSPVTETTAGVKCWSRDLPVEKIGIYIPGGTAPLFSTVLMLALPARLAGCGEIIMCTPPGRDGTIEPAILHAASLCGVTGIYRAGGAQAIAAMAYGTETVPRVFKIFGPGNQYVTRAKELVQLEGTAIDMPAGPSEVLVIADNSAEPEFIAADLLSQAEHGPDSQVILLTDDADMIDRVKEAVEKQMPILSRLETARDALTRSALILLSSMDECISFSNQYAPEHLIIATANPHDAAGKIRNAGSVFLGKFSCESAGDYATGTNHTLPTNGAARSFSGVSVNSFMKKIFFQELTAQGLRNIGPTVEVMAEAEKLDAHKNAVSVRLKYLGNEQNR
jgi:histidinol dehydrogenase